MHADQIPNSLGKIRWKYIWKISKGNFNISSTIRNWSRNCRNSDTLKWIYSWRKNLIQISIFMLVRVHISLVINSYCTLWKNRMSGHCQCEPEGSSCVNHAGGKNWLMHYKCTLLMFSIDFSSGFLFLLLSVEKLYHMTGACYQHSFITILDVSLVNFKFMISFTVHVWVKC